MDKDILLGRARAMRREPTTAEQVLWRVLRSRQFDGFKFRRQVPLGSYIADFMCLERRLVIECDGPQHAESRYDEARDRWLKAQGFRVLRFWNNEVLDGEEGVARAISEALAADPSPSPR